MLTGYGDCVSAATLMRGFRPHVAEIAGIRTRYWVGGEGRPLILVHGLGGAAYNFTEVAPLLARRHRVLIPDLPGHCGTEPLPELESLGDLAAHVVRIAEREGMLPAAVLGYSMGGRIALHFALAFPTRVEALILESASPGIEDQTIRRTRVKSDERLARVLEHEGIETFVDYWESIPLFASQNSLPEETRQRQRTLRLRQSAVGLANSLRGMGAGAMQPVWDRLRELRMPVLYLAGELDHKYCEIGQTLIGAVSDGRFTKVPGAGHTIHIERPDVYLDEVSSWVRECGIPQRKLILNRHENDGLL
jgi:2-succinyl-6-hydroxy-2,4-cyclohexadiene-1-carboxylate synthase